MLAWFKKKFGKQQEAQKAPETEQLEEKIVADTEQASVEAERALPDDNLAEAGRAAGSGETSEPAALDELQQADPSSAVLSACDVTETAEAAERAAEEIAVEIDAVSEVGTSVAAAEEVDTPALEAAAEAAPEAPARGPDSTVQAFKSQADAPAASDGSEDTPVLAEETVLAEMADALPDPEAATEEEYAELETISEEAPISSYTQEKPAAKSMFRRLQDRLGKTRNSFVYQLDRLFMGEKEISQELFDQLEELLITADLGVATTMELLEKARKRVKRDKLSDPQSLKSILKEEMLAYITASEQPAELVMPEEGPFVIMVVGVNGVGKTTTIGKIAAKFVRSGQSVLLIAGDTFRAAAIDQLKIWGGRVGVDVFAQKPGADPASVVFDGIDHGIALNKDVILIDTAGRLHTSVNLMEELKKMQRVMGKRLTGAPHEVLQVLDATTGQNGIAQAKLFHEAVGVSGLALTKLDGTAKGGIVANICRELKIPVRFIGIGEQLDDLRDFEAGEFVDALFAETAK